MASPSRCNKCTQQTHEPHFLKCDHFFCYRCVVTLYNEHVIATKMQTQKQGPTQFPCGVVGCDTMTPVPLGGLRNLPKTCQLTGALADLGLDKDKMASPSRCNKCTQQTHEPHFLKCDHSFCYRCVVTLYNEHVIATKMQTQKQGPTQFLCGVPGCDTMTPVPLGGLRNLPKSCQLTGAMANPSLDKDKISSPHCNNCTQQTRDLHFLKCGHFFCYGCVVNLYIEGKTQAQKQGPTYFMCGVPGCQMMTEVPEGGLRNLPRSSDAGVHRSLPRSSSPAGGLGNLSGGSSVPTGAMGALSPDSGKETPGVKQYGGYELKWSKKGYHGIGSLAMMGDGSCLVVTAAGQREHPQGDVTNSSTTLQRFSPEGKPTDLPFPCFAKRLLSVSINHSSTTVVVVEYKGKSGCQVWVYSKHNDSWQYSSFSNKREISQTAVTEDGNIVFSTLDDSCQQKLVLMSGTGQEEWTRSLPEGNGPTFICVIKDLIIISSLNNDTVTVLNRQGEPLHTLSSGSINHPSGVTSDSTGHLVIADFSNQSVSLFTPEGHFIKTLVKCQWFPVQISLSHDRFLLVCECTGDEFDLCLYELH